MDVLQRAWYGDKTWTYCLRPLAHLFCQLAARRRRAYLSGAKPVWRAPVPLLVVGNISVGGVGKTPLVAALAQWFLGQGWRPGIISRGYGSRAPRYPFLVTPASDVRASGDEPLLLARATHCPLVIDPDRAAAARYLLDRCDCDLILSDDGLQHYALGRDIEIAVLDGSRGLGNGLCLPAGPLREPPERLHEVDWVVANGGDPLLLQQRLGLRQTPELMRIEAVALVNLATGERRELSEMRLAPRVHAVAGIGNPARFFAMLEALGLHLQRHSFADHHRFRAKDLAFKDGMPVIMTQKDAVKCSAMATANHWYLEVAAQLEPSFLQALSARLDAIAAQRQAS